MKQAMLVLSVLAVLVFVAGVVGAEEESAWFDLDNCAFCKQMSNEEGLIESMSWETHLIENGALTIIVVPESKVEAFERAEKHMHEMGAKIEGGEKMHLCGFCQSYGMLMMSGAKVEKVDGDAARVTLMTSADSEVVKKIQTHAQKTIDEYNKMMAAEGQAHGG